MDFLKLIRLGSNVTNFMDLKPTERKNYMGNLLDEADIYLQYHKKIVADMRTMKSIIARDTDKLARLNITDIDREEEYLHELKERILVDLQEHLQQLKGEQSITSYELSNHQTLGELRTTIDGLTSESKQISKILESKRYRLVSSEKTQDELTSELITAKTQLESANAKRMMLVSDIDDCEHELSDLRIQRDKLDNDDERESCMNAINSLKLEIKELSPQFIDFKPSYTSEDIKTLLELLNKAQTILSATYEIGDGPIGWAIHCMRQNGDINEYVEIGLSRIGANEDQAACKHVMTYMASPNEMTKMKCDKDCPYRDFYERVRHQANEKREECESTQFYSYMEMAYKNIQTALKLITDNGDLFKKMPSTIQEMFIFKTLYTHIEKREWIYDLKAINSELSRVTEFEAFNEKKELLKQTQDKLDKLNDASGLSFVEDRITTLENKISANKSGVKDFTALISTLSDTVSALEDSVNIDKERTELKTRLADIQKEYHNACDEHTLVSKWRTNLNKLNEQIAGYEGAVRRRMDDIKVLERRVDEYHMLTKDLKRVKEDYDDWELARSTLSGKEGIPLIHIDLYLKKTRKIVNELLDIIYDGSLRIDQFEVSADTFRIPYTKNGKTISDAKLASQGESSFMTIALSFALSLQSISKYNIMLLDEIDSTLDADNREKFITILERMMDMVDTEQIFLISHNNMFDMYPVDYLDVGTVHDGESLTVKAMH